MVVGSEDLRVALRRWATGVTVVTTQHESIRHGMTVNSFTSLALEPPLVSVALERVTRTHSMVQQSGIFGVTILSNTQQEVSDCFAGRHTEHQDRFAGILTHTLLTGAPFIVGGFAFFDCRVVTNYLVGTHTLFVAEVIAVQLGESTQPIIYFNQSYWQVNPKLD